MNHNITVTKSEAEISIEPTDFDFCHEQHRDGGYTFRSHQGHPWENTKGGPVSPTFSALLTAYLNLYNER